MSQAEQYFRAVLDHPEDNQLRLIYADWLEECGDPRGELIRVQVELEQTPHADLHWRALKNRETDLLNEYLADWLGPSARRVWKGFADAQYQPFFAGRGGCRLHRGFRETARIRAKTFLEHADEIFAALPLRELHLFLHNDTDDAYEELAACEHLVKIRDLILGDPRYSHLFDAWPSRPFETFFQSARLKNLEAIRFHYRVETRRLVNQIFMSPHFGNLRTLELRMKLRPDENPSARRNGIRVLAQTKKLHSLTELLIVDHQLSDSMVQPLFKAPWFEQLKRLDLSGNSLSDQTFCRLADSSVCRQLETLRLSRRFYQRDSAYLHTGGCAALGKADFSELNELEMTYQHIGAGKLKTLLTSQALGKLERLDLSGNPLKDSGANAIAGSETLSKLRVLKLESCQLTDAGLTAIAQSPRLGQLEQLFVGGNTFTAAGFRALCDSPLIEHLRTLSLAGCGELGDAAFRTLARSVSFGGLTELDLTGQRMTAGRVGLLVDSSHLQELAHLSWFQSYTGRDHALEALLHARWPGRVRL